MIIKLGVATEISLPRFVRGGGVIKPILFAAKLVVTVGCFWYVLRKIDVNEIFKTLPTFDFRWAAFSLVAALTQIPLLALRLRAVVQTLAQQPTRLTFLASNAVTAICGFFAQVLPGVVSEGIRAWMLTRLGCDWRTGLTSVLIDRGIGLAVLIIFAFIILFLPSALNILAGDQDIVRFVFGGVLLIGVLALLCAPHIGPMAQRWHYSYWFGTFTVDAYRVLLGSKAPKILSTSCLSHTLTIVVIWSISHAQGLSLSLSDCAVVFTMVMGVVLIPISIGGWGLREAAVVSLLSAHGVAREQALLFSLFFGLVFVISALPGGVCLLYAMPAKSD